VIGITAPADDVKGRLIRHNANVPARPWFSGAAGSLAPKFTLAHCGERKKIAKSTAPGRDLTVLNLEPAGAGGVLSPIRH
jgi:hypothetical protein